MKEAHISFYLKANRIHIFVDTLREIGSPRRICFMISDDGRKLLIVPYRKKDFKSHQVPDDVYKGTGCMEVSSAKLCRLIARMYNWHEDMSYRVNGIAYFEQQVAVFDLHGSVMIHSSDFYDRKTNRLL